MIQSKFHRSTSPWMISVVHREAHWVAGSEVYLGFILSQFERDILHWGSFFCSLRSKNQFCLSHPLHGTCTSVVHWWHWTLVLYWFLSETFGRYVGYQSFLNYSWVQALPHTLWLLNESKHWHLRQAAYRQTIFDFIAKQSFIWGQIWNQVPLSRNRRTPSLMMNSKLAAYFLEYCMKLCGL